MLGLVLLSDSNEVIHACGDASFMRRLHSESVEYAKSKTADISEIASTSGVSSSTSSLNKPVAYAVTDVCMEIDKSSVFQMIFPLAIAFRSKLQAEEDNVQTIMTDQVQVVISVFEASSLVVVLADRSHSRSPVEILMNRATRTLRLHYGPFLELVVAEMQSVEKTRCRVSKRLRMLVHDSTKGSYSLDPLNVNVLFGNAHKSTRLQPFLKQIVESISEAIGSCRCLFMTSDNLLASVSSKDVSQIPLFSAFESDDIASIIELCRSLRTGRRKLLKCRVEQAWLWSTTYKRRLLTNLFILSLTGELDIVCIGNVEHTHLIQSICDLLDAARGLDSQSSTHLSQSILAVDQLVQKLCTVLSRLTFLNDAYVFLSNTTRTRTLIRSLWKRLRGELVQRLDDVDAVPELSLTSLSHASLARIGSTLSAITSLSSLSSSVHHMSASNTNVSSLPRHSGGSVHIGAMLSHFRRHLRSLLNEAHAHSSNVAKYQKFQSFVGAVRRVVDRRMTQHVSDFLSNGDSEQAHETRLKPVTLGFDMLAYRFESLPTGINFSHMAEAYEGTLNRLYCSGATQVTVGRTATGERLIKIKLDDRASKPRATSLLSKVSTLSRKEHQQNSFVCSAIFSGHVNASLAIRQTYSLANILVPHLVQASTMF